MWWQMDSMLLPTRSSPMASLPVFSAPTLPSSTLLSCSLLVTNLSLSLSTYMHCKGSRHRAAESRLKERELARQNEMNKRIALSDSSGGTAKSRTCNQKFESGSKPLIEQVLRAASGIFTHRDSPEELKSRDLESNVSHVTCRASDLNAKSLFADMEVSNKVVAQQHLDYQERRERELKFTAAGWKRDCYGKWYKDENVEFDSDEEDPNICLG
ncbi:uncharacterized protein LOC107411215 isoform X2 [Ziziphus jujuba]|uniref:Uncharacterized protein LOC107411215 isoform X2 n=1 Tax=Ziziphus jujuba TaxID=326968 RepID=A0ABM3ZSA0_ZIZJJ|nr:uncharacterized protein LOC107411215 isoform X2 [Ziziphus jujuba]